MRRLRALSLFTGIAGIDLAALSAGIDIVSFCEIDPFPVSILKKRFPGIPIIPDVKEIEGVDYADTVDLIYGGFPCQDLSVAGRQKGLKGERSGLWFEMLRVIQECRPDWVLAENVRGAINKALDTVEDGLESAGYKVWTVVLPASAFGAPHKRERMFVVGIKDSVVRECLAGLTELGTSELPSFDNISDIAGFSTGCTDMGYWPSPTVSGNYNRKGLSKTSGDGLCTTVWAQQWRTPSARDYRTGTVNKKPGKQINLNDQTGGQLNPAWVSQLMGFPYWWTDPNRDIYYAYIGDSGELVLSTEPPDTSFELTGDAHIPFWAELRALRSVYCDKQVPGVTVHDVLNKLSGEGLTVKDWEGETDMLGVRELLWSAFTEVGYIPCSMSACLEVWNMLTEREKYIVAGYALGEAMWPAALKSRIWMTPKAGSCGMTAKTKGRPIEKSTHLQTQVYCTENGLYPDEIKEQFPYEFPRTVCREQGKRRTDGRAAQIKALGNAVVPAQVAPLLRAIVFLDSIRKKA